MVALKLIVSVLIMLFVLMALSIAWASFAKKGSDVANGAFTAGTDRLDVITCQLGFCFGKPRFLSMSVVDVTNGGQKLDLQLSFKAKAGYILSITSRIDGKNPTTHEATVVAGNPSATSVTDTSYTTFNTQIAIEPLSSNPISHITLDIAARKDKSSTNSPLSTESVTVVRTSEFGTPKIKSLLTDLEKTADKTPLLQYTQSIVNTCYTDASTAHTIMNNAINALNGIEMVFYSAYDNQQPIGSSSYSYNACKDSNGNKISCVTQSSQNQQCCSDLLAKASSDIYNDVFRQQIFGGASSICNSLSSDSSMIYDGSKATPPVSMAVYTGS